jgi:hypothetical protein
MKSLFSSAKGRTVFDTKETVIELNGVKIEAFPSHHLDAMRGLPNVSFILLDEADFFPPGQQQDARDVSERYIALEALEKRLELDNDPIMQLVHSMTEE